MQRLPTNRVCSRCVLPVRPNYVREYKNCLYLIAKKMNGDYRTFEFGRIHDICLTKNSFSFVQDDELVYMYRHMYGVMKPAYGQEPERIVLRTTGDQTQRMRINPLHSTQRETKHTNEFSEFELLIYPTNDFLAEVFSQIERTQNILLCAINTITLWHKQQKYHAVSKYILTERKSQTQSRTSVQRCAK